MRYFTFLLLLFSAACASDPSGGKDGAGDMVRFQGKTMGSTYALTYQDSAGRNLQTEIESLLKDFNAALSTYDSSSRLSQFNRSGARLSISSKERYLIDCIELAKEFHSMTEGAFNPALKPLVNYWGFGYKEKRPVENASQAEVDSLLKFSNFDMLELYYTEGGDSVELYKQDSRLQIEFNAMAPGYAADLIGELLEEKGIKNYLIDVGGEILAKGSPSKGKAWRVGINVPQEGAATNSIQAAVDLQNMALATSGNYRSFYESGGKKYVHTINPRTGYTEQNDLLSVSIFAPSAALADALATACMAQGKAGAEAMLNRLKISAYFIYLDPQGQPQELWLGSAKTYFVD